MASHKTPFYEVDYRKDEGRYCPIIEVLVGSKKTPISAYCDTGCTTGTYVFNSVGGKSPSFTVGMKAETVISD